MFFTISSTEQSDDILVFSSSKAITWEIKSWAWRPAMSPFFLDCYLISYLFAGSELCMLAGFLVKMFWIDRILSKSWNSYLATFLSWSFIKNPLNSVMCWNL
jgi:hypothetical protein